MLVRPRCAQCRSVATWRVHVFLHRKRTGCRLELCGRQAAVFRIQHHAKEWTVTDLGRLVYT